MKSSGRLANQWRKIIRNQTVPGARVLLGSVFAHLLALVTVTWLVVADRGEPVIVLPARSQLAKAVSGALYLPPNSRPAKLPVARKTARRVATKVQNPESNSTVDSPGVQALRSRARQETAALMQNFKFRLTYGFSSYPKYELAVQTSGSWPVVTADQLPPHFEQYVIVEVTIDSEGRVADARITAGEVGPKIAQTVLSAVREFKYRPATREGIPVPSQTDLVIHIPT